MGLMGSNYDLVLQKTVCQTSAVKCQGHLIPRHVWLVHDVNHDAVLDHGVRDHVRQQLPRAQVAE